MAQWLVSGLKRVFHMQRSRDILHDDSNILSYTILFTPPLTSIVFSMSDFSCLTTGGETDSCMRVCLTLKSLPGSYHIVYKGHAKLTGLDAYSSQTAMLLHNQQSHVLPYR